MTSTRREPLVARRHADVLLRTEQITVQFGGLTAVDRVDLAVRAGEIVGIIGPNGAGKTTLLNAISGFVTPAEGSVFLRGERLDGLLPYQRARRGLGRSFQDARLYPTMTVRETLVTAFHADHDHGVFAEGLRLPSARRREAEIVERAAGLLELVDLDRYLDYRLSELSFGTTRAVELAWLAARQPAILLLDEPASGLQQSEVAALGGLVQRIRRGAAVVVIDHDVPFVSALADRLVAMNLGAVVAQGSAEVVLANDEVIESYLGTGRYKTAEAS